MDANVEKALYRVMEKGPFARALGLPTKTGLLRPVFEGVNILGQANTFCHAHRGSGKHIRL